MEQKEAVMNAGFKTVSEFVGYVKLHVKTDLALFSGTQFNALHLAAGYENPGMLDKRWVSLREDSHATGLPTISELCEQALELEKKSA